MTHLDNHVRIMICQYGDYREALDRRASGGPQTYRAQWYSMDILDRLIGDRDALIVSLSSETYDETRGNRRLVGGQIAAKSSGLAFHRDSKRAAAQLKSLAQQFNPTHLIIRSVDKMNVMLGTWALQRNIHVLPAFAHYFRNDGIKGRLRNLGLIRWLNDPRIRVVSNHNYPAGWSMAHAGVNSAKIVPWDYAAESHPEKTSPRTQGPTPKTARLLYAGALLESKGVGDLVEAMAILNKQGWDVRCDIFGKGKDQTSFETLTKQHQLTDRVLFRGHVPHEDVTKSMQAADLTIVPSRPEYPEGLPNVVYETFLGRTPLICSNHHVFVKALEDGEGCRFFEATNPQSLASTIENTISHEQQYLALCKSTLEAWQRIQCPVTLETLYNQWMQSTLTGEPAPYLQYSLANDGH